jgi:hypothetical protein
MIVYEKALAAEHQWHGTLASRSLVQSLLRFDLSQPGCLLAPRVGDPGRD